MGGRGPCIAPPIAGTKRMSPSAVLDVALLVSAAPKPCVSSRSLQPKTGLECLGLTCSLPGYAEGWW